MPLSDCNERNTVTSLALCLKPEDELGIPLLDDQHRGIISVINSLDYGIRTCKGSYFSSVAFNMMNSYTKIHFSTEEALMHQAGYPGLREHRQLHEHLIYESFTISSKSRRLQSPEIYLEFLLRWWLGHITQKDSLYAACIKGYFAERENADRPDSTIHEARQ